MEVGVIKEEDISSEILVKDEDIPFEILGEEEEDEEEASVASVNLLPDKTKERYQKEYENFQLWRKINNANVIDENALLAYVKQLSETFSPTSLWTKVSMLKLCLKIYDSFDISRFGKLFSFLRRQTDGYEPKKAKVLSEDLVTKFLLEADDHTFLLHKVILMCGIFGACKRDELVSLTIDDFKDCRKSVLVTLKSTTKKKSRTFVIPQEGLPFNAYSLYKKYADLRPSNLQTRRFFICYRNGKCVKQVVGVHTIGGVPKKIAKYFNLEHPELYTVYSFRRSSATMLVENGGDLLSVMELGGWESSKVAKNYIENSVSKRMKITKQLFKSQSTTVTSTKETPSSSSTIERTRVGNVVHRVTADKFETVLEDKTVFVDKTLFIRYVLEDSADKIMLTAPPRFGKTTNITTLRSFFARGPNQQELPDLRKETVAAAKELQKKYKLFKDLQVYQCDHKNVKCPAESSGDFKDCEVKRKFYMHCGQYPVVFLDFGTVGAQKLQSFLNGMQIVLQRAFHDHYYLIEYHEQSQGWTWSDKSMFTKGMQISKFLNYWEDNNVARQWHGADAEGKLSYLKTGFENLFLLLSTFHNTNQTGKKVILIIDEQDAPVLKALFDQSPDLNDICVNMRELMRSLLKSEAARDYLERAVITSRSAVGGVLSGVANNVDIRPFLDPEYQYYKCFGFNQAEVQMLVEKNFELEEHEAALKNIKLWYNSYVVEGKDQETYCPLSVKQYILQKKLKNYWPNSVGGQLLDQGFQHDVICKQIIPHLESLRATNIDIEIILQDLTVDSIQNLKNFFSTQENNIPPGYLHLFLRFLTECGFFSISKRQFDTEEQEVGWNVRIPNIEVGKQLARHMHIAILNKARTKLKSQEVHKLQSAFLNLQIEANETYIALAKALEDLYSDGYQPINHFSFQSDLSYILADRADFFVVLAEFPVANGVQPKTNLLVVCNETGIVLKLKRGRRETAFGALKEILCRNYWEGFGSVSSKIVNTVLIGLHLADDKKVTIRYLENPDQQKDIDQLLNESIHIT